MTTPTGDNSSLDKLEGEVELDLAIAESGHVDESAMDPADWLVDPAEEERDEVGLHSLLGAIEALEGDSHSHTQDPAAP